MTRQTSTEDKLVRYYGSQIIPQLFLCFRNAQLYEVGHSIFQEGILAFLNLLQEFSRHEPNLSLHVVKEYFFLNDVRLRINAGGYHIYRGLLEYLQKRSLGLLVFEHDVTQDELEKFFQIVARADTTHELVFEFIQQEMAQKNIRRISIEPLENLDAVMDIDLANLTLDKRELAISTYFKTTEILKEVYANIRQNRPIDIRKIKHIIHSIVDFILEGDHTLLAMTQIKDYPLFLLNHPTNVCILSVAVGQELGLRKKQIADLGFCALLHDVGMVKLPKELLRKIGKRLTAEEQKIMGRHTVYGAQALLKTGKINDVMIRAVLVCFQHHVGDIYSRIIHRGSVDLFSKIVCIASAYNMLTTPQEGLPAMKPEMALNTLMEESGEFYDPVLIKVFINTIGKYPVGSMVKLSTGEVGVVLKPNPNPKYLDRPIVKIITDSNGAPVEGLVVDLMEKIPGSKRYKRTIVQLIDTTDFELDVNDYITII
ncbi:MAG: HD domain-containing protein [Planctomycetota bacterium]|nr:MAG: HD domain-containing protein [Planctomycetota bacterium]